MFLVMLHLTIKRILRFSKTRVFPESSCSALTVPLNALISCTNQYRPGSLCTFRCERGYRLVGGATRRCDGAARTWTSRSPVCESTLLPALQRLNLKTSSHAFMRHPFVTLRIVAAIRGELRCRAVKDSGDLLTE